MSLYQRIIVPVDDSLPAHYGLRTAIALAHDQRAHLKLFTVIDEAPQDYAGSELGWTKTERWDQSLRANARHLLAAAVHLAASAGVHAEQELIEAPRGHVARCIGEAAQNWSADLLVLGSHGRHGLSHMLFGSTAETLLRQVNLPLLVVPCVHVSEPDRLSSGL